MRGELLCAGLVGARGNADQEVPVGFADVAGVQRARRADARDGVKEAAQCGFDDFHLAAARGGAGTRDDGAALGDERRVLDEAAVRVARIGGQDRERQSAGGERLAIALVLFERELRIRGARARLGESLRKVLARQPQECVRQHDLDSLRGVALQNGASDPCGRA